MTSLPNNLSGIFWSDGGTQLVIPPQSTSLIYGRVEKMLRTGLRMNLLGFQWKWRYDPVVGPVRGYGSILPSIFLNGNLSTSKESTLRRFGSLLSTRNWSELWLFVETKFWRAFLSQSRIQGTLRARQYLMYPSTWRIFEYSYDPETTTWV